jgi:hypothetical protein
LTFIGPGFRIGSIGKRDLIEIEPLPNTAGCFPDFVPVRPGISVSFGPLPLPKDQKPGGFITFSPEGGLLRPTGQPFPPSLPLRGQLQSCFPNTSQGFNRLLFYHQPGSFPGIRPLRINALRSFAP